MRLGGLKSILQVIHAERSRRADKLKALQFLMQLLRGRNGLAVKRFICNAPKSKGFLPFAKSSNFTPHVYLI